MKKLLLFYILLGLMACSHKQNIEVVVIANTNLCPNCYNEYRFLDSIGEVCKLHLLFQTTNLKEAQSFSKNTSYQTFLLSLQIVKNSERQKSIYNQWSKWCWQNNGILHYFA